MCQPYVPRLTQSAGGPRLARGPAGCGSCDGSRRIGLTDEENTRLDSYWLWFCIPQPTARSQLQLCCYGLHSDWPHYGHMQILVIFPTAPSSASLTVRQRTSVDWRRDAARRLDHQAEPPPRIAQRGGLLFTDIPPLFFNSHCKGQTVAASGRFLRLAIRLDQRRHTQTQ